MRSRSTYGSPGSSLIALAIGLTAGVAFGLLAAPMRGRDMRGTLRTRAQQSLDRARALIEQSRRAFIAVRDGEPRPVPLTAPFGEIAAMHGSGLAPGWEARP